MIARDIQTKLEQLATKFPVVTLTGIRQSGKSTLLRNCFPHYRYVSLEDYDVRRLAQDDPRGLLNSFGSPTIIDEAQHAPELFSYMQTRVDEAGEAGMYLLSGSHNFLLMEKVSQSLAGRTAVLHMSTLSLKEMRQAGLLPATADEWIYNGGFPRIYDKQIAPADYFPSYILTYIERDVRALRDVGNISAFMLFVRLCAGRVGQLLNMQSLATECGISVPTARAWLSVLEASNVAFLLHPYYRNFNKRLVKTPKLYFYDTGLVSSLLGVGAACQLATHYMRGALFENMVIAEFAKRAFAQGVAPQMYFWRDSRQNEVDLLVEENGVLSAYEIKSGATLNNSFYDGLKRFAAVSGLPAERMAVVYGGDISFAGTLPRAIAWREL